MKVQHPALDHKRAKQANDASLLNQFLRFQFLSYREWEILPHWQGFLLKHFGIWYTN